MVTKRHLSLAQNLLSEPGFPPPVKVASHGFLCGFSFLLSFEGVQNRPLSCAIIFDLLKAR